MDTPHGARGYFANLSTFRFLAATGVLLQHAEEIKSHAGFISYFHFNGIRMLGGTCVTAFFVLSGFLISFLLLREKEANGTVRLKFFFQRRFLRIWPLYLLTLLLYRVALELMSLQSKVFLYSPVDAAPLIHIGYWGEWALLLMMLPQFLLSIGHVFTPIHVWSIGVEEMFYLFWPVVVKAFTQLRKTFFLILTGYLIVYSMSIAGLFLSQALDWSGKGFWQGSALFLYAQRISCMAIGALAAEAVFSGRHKLLAVLRHPYTQACCYLALAALLGKGLIGPLLFNELYSVLFAIVIINIIHPQTFLLQRLVIGIMEKLGEISYGIYMYNPFAILLTTELFLITNIHNTSVWFDVVLFYILSLFITMVISSISYLYFEQPLLKLKKYAVNKG
jgi:peptidoglycan/LPS O-acetylase OafA/YrhL